MVNRCNACRIRTTRQDSRGPKRKLLRQQRMTNDATSGSDVQSNSRRRQACRFHALWRMLECEDAPPALSTGGASVRDIATRSDYQR